MPDASIPSRALVQTRNYPTPSATSRIDPLLKRSQENPLLVEAAEGDAPPAKGTISAEVTLSPPLLHLDLSRHLESSTSGNYYFLRKL